MSNLKFTIGAKTDIGNIKKVNQDALICKVGSMGENEFGLFAVCDGLGGLSYGEVASGKAIKYLNEWWNSKLRNLIKNDFNDIDIEESLKKLIHIINKDILDFSVENNTKLGTTISVLIVIANKYYIAHIGDSRIYKIDKKMIQLTKDHTHYQLLLDQGKIEEAKLVRKNVLTQCLGARESIDIYYEKGNIDKNCSFLICSDGFYDKMNTDNVIKFMKNKNIDTTKAQEECSKWIDYIKENGERDNISVVAINVRLEKENLLKKIRSNFGGRR